MTHFDTFSGYGGFSIALERVGIKTIGFSEIDKNANAVLKYHWPKIKNYGNIAAIRKLPDFDILTGGSPCQDFSIAGKREGLRGARSSLAWEYIRVLRLKKPKYFIWENVKGVMSSRGGWDFANLLVAFSDSGYDLWWQVLNAKDFGVAQSRDRVFVVGFRKGSPKPVFFETPNPQPQEGKMIADYGRYAVAPNKKLIELDLVPARPFQLVESRTEQGKEIRRQIRQTTGRDNTPRSKDDKKYIPKGEDIANCLTTNKDSIESWIFVDGGVRLPTPIERERLMGLPDDWTLWGKVGRKKVRMSDRARAKLCGNGVVVSVVEALARELFDR